MPYPSFLKYLPLGVSPDHDDGLVYAQEVEKDFFASPVQGQWNSGAPPRAVQSRSCRRAVQILSPFSDKLPTSHRSSIGRAVPILSLRGADPVAISDKLPTSRCSSSSAAVQIVSSRIPDPVAVQRGSYRRAVRILSPCGDKLPTLHRSSMGPAVQLLSPRSADPIAT
jgi:hypothetical protein